MAARLLPLLPLGAQRRIAGQQKAWKPRDLRQVARPGSGETRLLIAPANFAGQGYLWAQAAQMLPGTSARNLQVVMQGAGFDFPADVSVKTNVAGYSYLWNERQERALGGFTHVLLEAGRPLFRGGKWGSEWSLTTDQVQRIADMGLKVGLIWHGTDIRLPSRHASLGPHSPYRANLEADWIQSAEERAAGNARMADELGVPEFVSNPYLRSFRPEATWLPTLANAELWHPHPSKERRKPVVLHAPSKGVMKGSDAIRPAMEALHKRGVIDYVEVAGVPASRMPTMVRDADIVIDGVVNGQYGVASVEAMMTGRVAVAHVWDSVRYELEETSGMELPVVEASPGDVGSVVELLAADWDHRYELSQAGIRFTSLMHSNPAAASALELFLSQ